MGEFFLEIRCEEIPARMLQPAIREAGTRLFEELLGTGLTPGEVQTGFTPRRLVITLQGVPDREPDREEETLGPPAKVAFDDEGEPTAAAIGFAKKCGVETSELRRVTTAKGEYLGTTVKTTGRPAATVLAEIVPRILSDIAWAKSMRWGSGEGPWVRPVHGVVALYDGQVVPFELFGVASGDTTLGHPIHSPAELQIENSEDYRAKMSACAIEVRFDERRRRLQEGMIEVATDLGGELVDDPELLDKLAAICGIPGIVEGSFDAKFLALPREVLSASLRDHQSALTVEKDGELMPSFLTVMDRSDDPAGRVQSGNEWVVEARLEDARFFYGEDRKRSLEERRSDLDHLVFHVKLGTYADKTQRMVRLTESLCDVLGWDEELPHAVDAAGLLKVDLTTEMVKEFTSLQGVMGGIYAREDGKASEVWQAIYDQYLPASSEDRIPRTRAGIAAAIADRVDTLVGMFGLGLIPSGSRDPFGLRRAAQGLVRIVLEAELPLDLDLVAALAARNYGDRIDQGGEEILLTLRPFLHDRVRHLLGLEGYAYDTIEAALGAGSSNLPDLVSRIDAVHRVREEPGFLSVALAAKRIANIVRDSTEFEVDTELLREAAEIDLHAAAESHRSVVREAEGAGEYEKCLRQIADLAEVLDRFFVEVLVMDEDPEMRQNRIGLLQSIQRMISRTARLTEVVVDKSEHRERAASGQQD